MSEGPGEVSLENSLSEGNAELPCALWKSSVRAAASATGDDTTARPERKESDTVCTRGIGFSNEDGDFGSREEAFWTLRNGDSRTGRGG